MWCLLIASALLVSEACAQTIFPTELEGGVGDSTNFICTHPRASDEIQLERRTAGSASFVLYESTPDGLARLSRTITNVTAANFTFGPLRLDDDGTMFRCVSVGDVTTIRVIFAPDIRLVQQIEQITEGDMVTIIFNVSGNPPPTSAWRRNGAPLMNSSQLTANPSSLVLNPADRQHAGAYQLIVSNSAGAADFNFTLDILYGPEFLEEFIIPNNLRRDFTGQVWVVAVGIGQNATLVCDAVGNPTPTVDHSVPQGSPSLISNNNIMITRAESANAGSYNCSVGDVVRNFQVYVGGVPRPVSDVSPTINSLSRTVDISWQYDDSVNGVPAIEFILTVAPNGGVSNISPLIYLIPSNLDEFKQTICFDDLVNNQTYNASIVVRNLQGNSTVISDTFRTPAGGSMMLSASWSLLSLGFLVLVMCL